MMIALYHQVKTPIHILYKGDWIQISYSMQKLLSIELTHPFISYYISDLDITVTNKLQKIPLPCEQGRANLNQQKPHGTKFGLTQNHYKKPFEFQLSTSSFL